MGRARVMGGKGQRTDGRTDGWRGRKSNICDICPPSVSFPLLFSLHNPTPDFGGGRMGGSLCVQT